MQSNGIRESLCVCRHTHLNKMCLCTFKHPHVHVVVMVEIVLMPPLCATPSPHPLIFVHLQDGRMEICRRSTGQTLCYVCTILIFSVQAMLHELSCPNYANATELGGEANALTLSLMYIINACVFRDGKQHVSSARGSPRAHYVGLSLCKSTIYPWSNLGG